MLPVIGAPNALVNDREGLEMHEFIFLEHGELVFTVFLLKIGPGHLKQSISIAIALALMLRMPQKCVQYHDLWVLQKVLLLTCKQTVLNNII